MTFDPYGYTDPYEAAREVQQRVQPWALYPPGFPGVPEGPLGDLQNHVAGVLNGADSHHVYLPGPDGSMLTYPRGRQPSIAGDMLMGAFAGFAGWYVWQRMRKRRAVKGEYMHPFFRFLMIWWGFMLAGFGLSLAWPLESDYFLGIAFVAGTVLSLVYLVYRVTGHGRFNSRRGDRPYMY